MTSVIHHGSVPRGRHSDLTRRTADFLAGRIEEGRYTEKLPGVHALGKELGVSFLTVNKAVDLLVEEGRVYRIPCSGTYVSARQKPLVRNLAAVVGGVGGPIHAELLAGMQQKAFELEQHIFLGGNVEWAEDDKGVARALAAERVDGVLFWPGGLQESRNRAMEMLCQRGIPCVLVMNADPEWATRLSYVHNDDEAGTRMAVAHLIQSGRRNIAFVEASLPKRLAPRNPFPCQRRRGYERAMEEAGLAPRPTVPIPVRSVAGEARLGRVPPQALRECDAFLTYRDDIAIHVKTQCDALGIRIPDDLALVGFDDSEGARVLDISSVRQPLRAIGAKAVDLLVHHIEGRYTKPRELRMKPSLVVRASSRRTAL